jgi:hypothetical protein
MNLLKLHRILLFRILLVIILFSGTGFAYSQIDTLAVSTPDSLKIQPKNDTIRINIPDTLKVPLSIDDSTLRGVKVVKKPIRLEMDQALSIIRNYYMENQNRSGIDESLQKAIERLILYVENGPIDTTIKFLQNYPFKTLESGMEIPSIPVVDSLQATDTTNMENEGIQLLAGKEMMDSIRLGDTLALAGYTAADSLRLDSLKQKAADTLYIESYPANQFLSDTLRFALNSILDHVQSDSTNVWLYNITNDSTQIVIRKDSKEMKRFWLKNEVLDSLGIWVQAYDGEKLKFLIDDNYYYTRYRKGKKKVNYVFESQRIDDNLRDVKLIKIEKKSWAYKGMGELLLSQVYLNNWTKGGENSISSLFRGEVNANYKKDNYIWNNSFRLKLGFVALASEGIRKNTDTWEINSNFGLKASKKWYYSLAFNFKSQLAKGYNYPDVTTVVSSFISPGNMYSSIGMEYKPNKTNSIIFSPVTYKAVFVIDTARVDQTKFGVAKDRMAKNEVGMYLKAHYIYKIKEDWNLENRLHFFTNYNGFNKIDFDWEAILRVKIGPFFSFSFSTHLIYDTDTTFPIYDDSGNEIGRKAKLQVKEWLGIGLTYRF